MNAATTKTVTLANIIALRDEAACHGDTEMQRIADAAIDGFHGWADDAGDVAWSECERVIRDVHAMDADRYDVG